MTTYPGAIDSFVDPVPTDQTNSSTVPHAQQHANINDAMVAVQTAIGTTSAPKLQLIIDSPPVTTATANILANHFTTVDTTAQSCTLTLPNAPADRTICGAKQVVRGGTNTVSVVCAGIDTFDTVGGGTTSPLTTSGQGKLYQYIASTHVWMTTSADLLLSQLDLRYAASGSGVTSVTADDGSIVVNQATGTVNIETGTLDVIATAAPPIASVPMNNQKITGLANGTVSTDAAAYGQVSSLVTGVSSVTSDDASIVVNTATGTVNIETGTLDAIATAAPPVAAVPLNAQKITGLANGSGAQDAAAFGQIPVIPGGGSPAPTLALGASQATSFTCAANTLYPCSATLTATLPVSPAVGTVCGVYRTTASTVITLAAGAGGTINGLASVPITSSALSVDPLIMVQATSSTTWIIISAVGNDFGQGMIVGGQLFVGSTISTNSLIFTQQLRGHVVAKTANYTTTGTDWWVQCTSNSFTVTLGTASFGSGTQQLVTNPGTGTVTIAAVSGTMVGPVTLPPKSGSIWTYDGTNWNCVGSWGTVTDSSPWVTISNPAITSGVAFTCSTTSDGELLVPVTLGGTGTFTMGPSTGAENTILPAASVLVAGAPLVKHIPKGWKAVLTLVTATIGTPVFTPF